MHYTETDHDVWATLYQRRMPALERTASRTFLDGASAIGLEPHRVPDLDALNGRLTPRTGWAATPVSGFLPAPEFFASLARKRFPTVTTVRGKHELDYTPAPDIFHDVFGHVPLHADPVFAEFLQRFGARAAAASTAVETTRMARLFWFTVEFGLIRERGQVKIYGSGLISSHADAANALGPACDRRPFSLEAVMAQDFDIDHVQPVLFVIDDFEQLFDVV